MQPLDDSHTESAARVERPRSNRAVWIVTVFIVFLVGLGVGVAQRLATLPADDESWLGTVRDGWSTMYQTMSGDADRGKIEYFVYHPDVERSVLEKYASDHPQIEDVVDTLYDSASVVVVARENRSVLQEVESQPWAQFAIRGELMFFCH